MDLKYLVDGREKVPFEIIDEILEARGVVDVEHFLNPSEQDILPYTDLKNIDKAADIVMDAIDDKKKIFVNFDSDLDGVSAGTIMYKWLSFQTEEKFLDWSINSGKSHGMTFEIVDKMVEFQPDVVIIVDSLDNDLHMYKQIKQKTGAEIIVLDHHMISPDVDYDSVVTLVSSQRDYANTDLCGAGVAYKFVQYMNIMAPRPFDYGLAELAAAGTIGDMMAVDEEHMENRAIVNAGLGNGEPANYLIQEIVGNYEFNSKTFSFSVAPLINASNRMKENVFAAESFLGDFCNDVSESVRVLRDIKDRQNELVDRMMNKISKEMTKQKWKNFLTVIIDASEAELSGLIGNKIMEKYGKPVLVLIERIKGYSGSGRAKGYKNFKEACEKTGLISCAGHENAFGIKFLPYENYEAFCKKLDALLPNEPKEAVSGTIDCFVEPEDITLPLIEKVKEVDRISGYKFPSLKFAIRLTDYDVTTMSQKKHLVFLINGSDVVGIKWNEGNKLEEYYLHAFNETPIIIAGSLDCGPMGRYNKRMIIEDIIVEGLDD